MKKLQKMDDKKKLKLVEDYNKGAKTFELVSKYQVSNARIYQILREMEATGHDVQFRLK